MSNQYGTHKIVFLFGKEWKRRILVIKYFFFFIYRKKLKIEDGALIS